MKKKLLLGTLLLSMAFGTACAENVPGTEREAQKAVGLENESMENQREESRSVESQSPESVEQEKKSEDLDATINRYQGFLRGEEKLYFHQIAMNYPEAESFEDGYLLNEVIAQFKEQYYGMQGDPAVEYAYIDCGDDGVSELAVRFVGMGIYEPGDDSTLVYIIKEIDEKLELCYCYETWARSETAMNQKGYITSGGSNGASNHGYGAGCIDGTGKWHYLYYQEEEADINQLMYSEVLLNLPRVAAGKNYEGTIVFVTTTFEDMSGPEAYYNTERFYTYYIEGMDGDVYSEGIYKEIFEEAGVKVYRPEEIQQMIADKEALAGVTEAVKNAPEINWEQF